MPRATVQVRVPFVDVDASQRIHFTAMFRYFEVAEHALMRSLGFPYASALTELAMPRVHLSCDFLGAVRFDDVIDVTAEVTRVGRSSWTVAFAARPAHTAPRSDVIAPPERTGEGIANTPTVATRASAELLARGQMTIVVMDPATERAQPIPPDLRTALLGEGERGQGESDT